MPHFKHTDFKPREYNPLHLAYLAGIIDGEGCIHIGYYFNKSQKRSTYHTLIQVTSTDKPLIEWLFQHFEGKAALYTKAQTPKNSRQTPFVWKVTGETLTHICRMVLPYMISKKDQIEIMLKMRSTFHDQHEPKKGQQGIQSMSQELIDYRHSLMLQLRELHCRKGSPKALITPCAVSPST
jgi:hypothetical protein